MKNFITIFTLSFLLIHNSFAADSAKQKIGFINMQKISMESSAAKNLNEQLQKKREEMSVEFSKKEDSLIKMDKELQDQQSVLSKEKLEDKKKYYQKQLVKVQNEYREKAASVDKATKDGMIELQETLFALTQDIAKEKSYDIILNNNLAVYYDEKFDITNEVIKRLNKKLVKIDLKF